MADVHPDRPTLLNWVVAVLLAANLAWTTLCLGGFLAQTMVVTSALTIALLVIHLAGRAWGRGGRLHPAGWCLVPFLVYAAINVAWITPVPWLGWRDWLLWAQMAAILWVTLNECRAPAVQRFLLAAIAAIGVAAVAVAAYQRFIEPEWLPLGRTQVPQFAGRASGPFGPPNSQAGLLLLLLPAAALLALAGSGLRARLASGVLALVYAFGLLLTISRGGWLALVIASTAWPLVAPGWRWPRRLAVSAGVFAACAAAIALAYLALPTVRVRIDKMVQEAGERSRPIMWRGAWKIFQEHKAFGSGAGSYNSLFEKHRPESYQDLPQWAHNDYLNTLSDYGITGAALLGAGLAAIAILSRPARHSPLTTHPQAGALRAGLAIGLTAFALQLFVDFNLKIPALGMIVATLGGIWLVVSRPGVAKPAQGFVPPGFFPRIAAGLAACAAIVALVLFVNPLYRAEGIRQGLRREIDRLAREAPNPEKERAILERARVGFAEATRLDPANGHAWADRAYAESQLARHVTGQSAALGRTAEGFAREAIKRSPAVYEFWMRLGVALDLQNKWADAGGAFNKGLEIAPKAFQPWFYNAYHLSLNPWGKQMAIAAVAICLRLDPGNREAEALKQRLAATPR